MPGDAVLHLKRRGLGILEKLSRPPSRERICPDAIERFLPPHSIDFHPKDPNLGRSCARCGFAIPQGCRYIHAEWCKRHVRHMGVDQ